MKLMLDTLTLDCPDQQSVEVVERKGLGQLDGEQGEGDPLDMQEGDDHEDREPDHEDYDDAGPFL